MPARLVATDTVRHLRTQPRRGALIVFEGVPGSGKTTQLRLLESHLRHPHRRRGELVVVHDEAGTPFGASAHQLLREHQRGTPHPVDARAEALLRAAARAQLVAAVIRPALRRGAVVLCEGWVDSYRAVHSREDADHEVIEQLVRYSSHRIRPDLTVLLDSPAPVALLRRSAAGAIRRAHPRSLPEVDRLRNLLLAQAAGRRDRYLAVPAADPPEDIAHVVAARVDTLLAQRAGQQARVSGAAV